MADETTPLNKWIEEEQHIPVLIPDMDAEGNLSFKQGERVVTEKVMYTPLIPHQTCEGGNHAFELVNGGKREAGRVLVQCRNCSLGKDFIPGIHQLIDGQIVERKLY